jgi:hypothetical protein
MVFSYPLLIKNNTTNRQFAQGSGTAREGGHRKKTPLIDLNGEQNQDEFICGNSGWVLLLTCKPAIYGRDTTNPIYVLETIGTHKVFTTEFIINHLLF